MAYVRVEEHGDVALVRVDRPPANALDPDLLHEARAVADDLTSSGPGAVVLTGREGFFSAGLDLKLVPTLDAEGQRTMVDGVNRLMAAWYSFPRPVVCAVNGHAIAGGMIIALCGDYRVGCKQGKLGLTELRAGVPYRRCRWRSCARSCRRPLRGCSPCGPIWSIRRRRWRSGWWTS